jgi:hypothetical protein
MLNTYVKQPTEVKDYDIDYSKWLTPSSDRIVSVATGLRNAPDDTLKVDRSEFTDDIVKVWVSGGTDGATYEVKVTVTTAGGRVDQCEIVFRIKEM